MVSSIISALFSVPLCIFAGMGMIGPGRSDGQALHGIQIFVALIQAGLNFGYFHQLQLMFF